ncbi:MAG TPA: PepSY-associated TM helix domain-containing protein [Myxococcales bacterium]|nr:PepSY-associated TM helix domain-containing protein [Myxococcales bacterium]
MPADLVISPTVMPAPAKSIRAVMHRLVLSWHRWTGLTIGLVLVFMAATGILLSYRSRMEPAVYRHLLTAPACATRVPLDALASSARAAHPKGEFDYIRIKGASAPSTRIPATQVRLSGPGFQDDVFFDPCTGAVLGQRGRYGGFFGATEALHKFKFVKNGYVISGTAALLLVFMLAGAGIYLWWPRRLKCLKPALKPNPHLRGRERTINLHKVLGVYASFILVPTALTGLPQAFDWFQNVIYWMTASPKPAKPQSAPLPGSTPLGMETYWRKLQSVVPDPAEALIHFPARPSDPVEIFAIERGAPHANARTLLFLDAYSGRVLRFTPYAQSSLGHRAYFWTLSWHTGMVGGVVGPSILISGALALLFLAWSGVSSFLRRALRAAR